MDASTKTHRIHYRKKKKNKEKEEKGENNTCRDENIS